MKAKLQTLGFRDWLAKTVDARRSGEGVDVECGECRGCCASSYFIHVAPDETGTLAAIPPALLFTAPGLPKGHKLLGYTEKGHCPMFKDNACSIYADRPRTCRAYDCRVFAATGFTEGADKPAIAEQAERWRFGFEGPEDEALFAAVQTAARFLRQNAARFPVGFIPPNAPQQAMLAIRVHGLFLEDSGPETGTEARIARILADASGIR